MMSLSYSLLGPILLLFMFTSCEGPNIATDYAVGIIIEGQIKSESDILISEIMVIGGIVINPDCTGEFKPKRETMSDSLGKFKLKWFGFGHPQYLCVRVLVIPDSNQHFRADSVSIANVYFNYINDPETLNLIFFLEKK